VGSKRHTNPTKFSQHRSFIWKDRRGYLVFVPFRTETGQTEDAFQKCEDGRSNQQRVAAEAQENPIQIFGLPSQKGKDIYTSKTRL
jgi:hypothetical protein